MQKFKRKDGWGGMEYEKGKRCGEEKRGRTTKSNGLLIRGGRLRRGAVGVGWGGGCLVDVN